MKMRIPKQKSISWLGALHDAFTTSLPILSAVQFLTILTLFYNDLSVHILPMFPWMTFPIFIIGVAFIMCGVMVLVYKYLLPSIWTFRGKQMYGFESELLDEVKKLREEVKALKKEENKNG
jgi:hypothetical protein